jgi:hypothetical protein
LTAFAAVGALVIKVGFMVGLKVVGATLVGEALGLKEVGEAVGELVGESEGALEVVGDALGLLVGPLVGTFETEGERVGLAVGLGVGDWVGPLVGARDTTPLLPSHALSVLQTPS